MQTFLPYPSIVESVRCLDSKRLGKQRVEALQILKALSNPAYGWQNHPAVNMWRGYEQWLTIYMNYCIYEWVRRGYNNTMLLCVDRFPISGRYVKRPDWWEKEEFHSSHRSALLKKDPKWYSRFGWTEEPKLDYVWPV